MFEVGDAQALRFADGAFDAVRTERMLMHVPDADRAFAEMVRVLRPGGRLAVFDFELSAEDFDDLCRVHLFDWLEQVPRSKWWDYRRAGYRRLAERLGGVAAESYDRVFAAEAAGTGGGGES